MYKVTFEASYQVKEGHKWISKVSRWDEIIKTEADARLRAMALNWSIIRIEKSLA